MCSFLALSREIIHVQQTIYNITFKQWWDWLYFKFYKLMYSVIGVKREFLNVQNTLNHLINTINHFELYFTNIVY